MSFLGYVLLLTAASLCTAAPAPDEQRQKCPLAYSPKNLEIIDPKEAYYSNDTVTMKCAIGYKMNGSPTVRCIEGKWEQPPVCTKSTPCRKPQAIRNGVIIESFKQKTYVTDDIVKYQCNPGYHISGSEEITCANGQWSAIPTCTEDSCDAAPEVPHATVLEEKKTYNHGETAKYECDNGFGISGDNSASCVKGKWYNVPTCVATSCTLPPPVPNARINGQVRASYASGERVTYSCHPDYSLERSFSGVVVCKNTQWTEVPECRKIRAQCGPPPVVQFGDTTTFPQTSYKSGDSVEYKCPAYHILKGNQIVRCVNGVWDEAPVCLGLTPCRKPPAIRNGAIIESFKQQTYVTDNIVKYQCNPGYHISGSEEITCANGQWSALPTCTEDSCDAAPEVPHATVLEEKKTYNHGETAKYECENGFGISGDNSAICVKGKWYNIPTCVATSCTLPPPVPNARINGQVRASYASGERVTYSCHPDYSLERSFSGVVVCKNTQWTEVPVCRKIGAQCGPPPVVQFGDTTKFPQTSYKSGDSVEYKCPSYHILKGNQIVRCVNGVWDEAPVCLEPCTAKVKDMEENNIRLKWINNQKIYLEHGDFITFRCKSGYEAPPDTQMRIVCEQGKLEYPKCFKTGYCVLEQQTMITNNIHYNVSTVVDHGQIITFQCSEGMMPEDKLEAKCDGRKINYPKCTAPKSCKTPEILNGFIRSEQQANYDSGSYVDFQCNEGYVINGPINVKCEHGQWTDLPVCHKSCKTPEILNGFLRSEQQQASYHSGSYVDFQCNDNYVINGPINVKCENGHWTDLPVCLKSCKAPEILNGFLRSEQQQASYDSGSYVDFQCNEGYAINGPINVKCENGQWTDLPVCFSQCKISTEDLTKHNIQLLPSADPKNILDSNHRHGAELSVTCKSGFRRPNQAALVIECYDGKFRYPRCFSGKTCRIDEDNLDRNNLELDEVHDDEVYYEEGEVIQFRCKSGFRRHGKLTGTCSGQTLNYPRCTARS